MRSNEIYKVAFVVDPLRGGGIASTTVNHTQHYISSGFKTAIIVLNKSQNRKKKY